MHRRTCLLIRPLFLLLILFFFSSWKAGLAGQLPASSVTIESSQNSAEIEDLTGFELVTQIGGSVKSVAVRGQYAYLGLGQRLAVLDITNPDAPVMLGQTSLLPGLVEDVSVDGNYAFVVEGSSYKDFETKNGGLHVVDVSDPAAPRLRGFFETQAIPTVTTVFGSYVYVADNAMIYVLDVSNPDAPVKIASLPSRACVVKISQDASSPAGSSPLYAYVAYDGCSPTYHWGMEVLDISDPAHPSSAGYLELTTIEPSDLAVQSGRAYIVSEYSLGVVDVSNPYNPVLAGESDREELNYRSLFMFGGCAYVGDLRSVFHIFDLSDPTHPVKVGEYATPGFVEEAVLAGDRVYLAQGGAGLQILDLNSPLSPGEVGRYVGEGFINDVVVSGRYAYTSGSSLSVFDLHDPAHPERVASIPLNGRIAAIADGMAFVAEEPVWLGDDQLGGGLRLVDISNPSELELLGYFETPGVVDDIAVAGRYAYVADYEGGLRTLDVSNPHEITEAGFLETENDVRGVAVGSLDARPGQLFAYLAVYQVGLQIVNVTDPAHPVVESTYTDGYSLRLLRVRKDGSYVYASDLNFGLLKLDVTDPSQPERIYQYDTPDFLGYPEDLEILGENAFLAQADKGLFVISKSGGYVGKFHRLAEASGVAGGGNFGDYIYLAGSDGGLFVAWMNPYDCKSIGPDEDSLLAGYDGTSYQFPAMTFSESVGVCHYVRYPENIPSTGGMSDISHFFLQDAWSRGVQMQPGVPYSMTVTYSDQDLESVSEDTLALYSWDGSQWVKEETSFLNVNQNTLTATPDHFSLWGVLDSLEDEEGQEEESDEEENEEEGSEEKKNWIFIPMIIR